MRTHSKSKTFLLLALLTGCSGSDDSAIATDPLHIKPVDNENWSHVTLQLPTDACQPGTTCAKVLGHTATVYVDGAPVALGASTRLKPGTHNIAVNNLGWQLTTTPGQVRTVTLAVADRKCTNASLPNLPSTDFGGTVTVKNAACPTSVQGSAVGVPAISNTTEYYDANCTSVWTTVSGSPNCSNAVNYSSSTFSYRNSFGTCVPMGTGSAGCVAAANAILQGSTPGNGVLNDAYEAYVPGTLSATVNGTAQSLTLNEGDETDFAFTLPVVGTVPATFATNITFGDSRDNPDAVRGTITSSCSGDRSYTIPSATGTPAPLALNAFVNSGCTYTLTVGGRTQALNQAQTNAITLHRIDVDSVTITREDGSTYVVSGTYTLNYGGVQVAGPYSTGTGIDVLPGTYQFSLNYSDADGPKTKTQTLTF
jgi:hypothetical protein